MCGLTSEKSGKWDYSSGEYQLDLNPNIFTPGMVAFCSQQSTAASQSLEGF